jgi:DNA invertase Pin-like site-specific DNA recombinase
MNKDLFSLSGNASKILPSHLEKDAYIYIRQSTPKQVQQNRESQQIQYQLTKRAEIFGWRPEKIHVIDSDLGLSGEGSRYRQGFQELVAALSLGQVGIVFGYEVSRLARNNSDWYQLLDLAAMFSTLIADYEGVYDPGRYNDRLLLGLKGTMSEAELHSIRQRMNAGRLNQVSRGEFRQRLPIGFVRLPDMTVAKDPDDQVRHILDLVFAKFEELGSCRQVLLYLQREKILLPRRLNRRGNSEIVWCPANDSMVYTMISNPAYAGAFAYGRTQAEVSHRRLGQPGTGRVHKSQSEWIHLQQNVYPAYITWEQYLANKEKMRQNIPAFSIHSENKKAQGAPRNGTALLQGMVVCGFCGGRMRVKYKSTPRYECASSYAHRAGNSCQNLHAPTIEYEVINAFFSALQPAQLDALQGVLDAQHVERDRLARQWREHVQRSQYESSLAERQYNAVDPANRLVAAELERRWETKLRDLQDATADFERFQQRIPIQQIPAHLRSQFQQISKSLPDLWPHLSAVQKKELLRSLIQTVILKRITPDTVEIRIVWISGHYTILNANPPIENKKHLSNYSEMVKRIRELWQQGSSDDVIAQQVMREGFRSARSDKISGATIVKIRIDNEMYGTHWRSRGVDELDGFLTVRGLTEILNLTSRTWVYRRIADGTIATSDLYCPTEKGAYLIKNNHELIERLIQLRKRSD